jgi:hypothetical protein
VVGFLEGPTWLTGRRIGETSSDVAQGVSGSVWSIAPLMAAGDLGCDAFNWIGPSVVAITCASSTTPRYPRKVGVAAQYASRWPRPANCQTLVNRPCWREMYPADMRMIWPVAGPGPSPSEGCCSHLSTPSEDVAGQRQMAHHQLAHRRKAQGLFAVRLRVADARSQRIRDEGQQHLPGDEAWLTCIHVRLGDFLWVSWAGWDWEFLSVTSPGVR